MNPRTVGLALFFVAIVALIAWLVNKMARTDDAEYRLLVIGIAIGALALGLAIAGGIKRARK